MTKKRTKKKRKIYFSRILLLVSFGTWLIVSLFVKTSNASLTMEIQKLNDELAMLSNENQTLNFEIQSLENKDRIYEVAQTADMSQVQDNIISIIGE